MDENIELESESIITALRVNKAIEYVFTERKSWRGLNRIGIRVRINGSADPRQGIYITVSRLAEVIAILSEYQRTHPWEPKDG